MVMAYFMAQLMPWATDKARRRPLEASGQGVASEAMKGEVGPGWGSLLVLGILAADRSFSKSSLARPSQ